MKEKRPIDVNTLDSYARKQSDLADACLDYLGIEFADQKAEIDSHISKHFQQRLRTGKSVAVRIEDVEFTDNEAKIRLVATVDYSKFPYNDPSKVLAALRMKENGETSSGEFVKAIPVDGRLEPKIEPALYNMRECPSLTVQSIDIDENNPERATIVLNGLTNPDFGGDFLHGQPKLDKGPADEPGIFSAGDRYILDPSPDDYTAESAYYVLQNPEYNGLLNVLDQFLDGDTENTSEAFDQEAVNDFLDWMRDDWSEPLKANEKQGKFISDVSHEVSLLQGPPGTGKTSGAVAPAIVARLLAYDDPGPCRELVTGASNKAINEVMEDVVELIEMYKEDPNTGDALDDVMLLRVTQPPENEEDAVDGVAYTAFYSDEAESKHKGDVKQRLTKTNLTPIDDKHIIAFGTPRRVWRIGKSIIPDFKLDSTGIDRDTGRVEGGPPSDHELENYRLFDVIVADEASMMNLPGFLLSGTFYDSGGNILLSGDHRQLPPVRKHDWTDEFRPSVTGLAPYLSVLNFFRLLRGDDLQVLDDELQALIDITGYTGIDIPMHQLEITYRCHTRIAEFLRNWVYWKLDGLEYSSEQTWTINDPTPSTTGIGTALEPNEPLVVVTYDDESSQQANELEAKLATQLVTATDSSDDAGIVTPHNAQRGLLETTLEHKSSETAERTDIDTVERFQGGERDMILLSGTVSDPDYVAAESEFLLNLNRLNVAMSRMKKKLVIVASEAIFDHIPSDVDEYNQALLWKGLAKEAGLGDDNHDPDWEGSITDFTGLPKEEFDPDSVETTVRVYCF